jgi:hypothetical protein
MSVPSSRSRCPEMSVNNYHTMPRNIPEERRSHQHSGGSQKSRLSSNSYFVLDKRLIGHEFRKYFGSVAYWQQNCTSVVWKVTLNMRIIKEQKF